MTKPTRCQRCGQPVFFYSNEYGSRVLFDELGGKWHKHDCSKVFRPQVILIKRKEARYEIATN